MKRVLLLCVLFSAVGSMVFASDNIQYNSEPDEVVIFMNNVAFARDSILLPGGVDVEVILPDQIFQDTLVLRENGERVPMYRINRRDALLTIRWQSASQKDDVREVTLEYVMSGLSWTPKYDMWLPENAGQAEGHEMVAFDFFAEVTNNALPLEDTVVRLVAGRVDTSQQLDAVSTVTMNQMVAGYDRSGAEMGATVTGAASIQHIYSLDTTVDTMPGDVVYINVEQSTLPARRLLLWNARSENQVDVIYKVRNESSLPFAEGIVRSYQGGMFIGSDFVELTPIGGEGSITVGNVQDVRVTRTETRSNVGGNYEKDTQHDVELTLTNFTGQSIDMIIVDYYSPEGLDFSFSHEPERQGDNLFRWELTIDAGETMMIRYQFFD